MDRCISRMTFTQLTLAVVLCTQGASLQAQCCDPCELPTLFSWAGCPVTPRGNPYDEPLTTDRPDFTESATTVGRGVVQLEMGYLYGEDHENGGDRVRNNAYPNSLLRVGLCRDWLEFRLGWAMLDQRTSGRGERSSNVGAQDMLLGVKLALTEQCGWRPETAAILQMTVPTGDSAYTADRVLIGGVWIYSTDINDYWSIGGQTQLNQAIDELDHVYTEFGQSAVTGITLTEKLSIFGEWFALIPHSALASSADPVHYLDGGFTYLLSNNLQYDIWSGIGLNDEAADYFIGSGLSVRF